MLAPCVDVALCPVCLSHVLPMQLLGVRRIVSVYQPSVWLSLHHLHVLLALPSVPDAALLCKSLLGLAVRRPDEWTALELDEQETNRAVAAENAAAAATANQRWAVQTRARVNAHDIAEADPIVFRSYYQRELNRRLARMRVQDMPDDDEGARTKSPHHASAAASADASGHRDVAADDKTATASSTAEPLWRFLPATRMHANCVAQCISGNFGESASVAAVAVVE